MFHCGIFFLMYLWKNRSYIKKIKHYNFNPNLSKYFYLFVRKKIVVVSLAWLCTLNVAFVMYFFFPSRVAMGSEDSQKNTVAGCCGLGNFENLLFSIVLTPHNFFFFSYPHEKKMDRFPTHDTIALSDWRIAINIIYALTDNTIHYCHNAYYTIMFLHYADNNRLFHVCIVSLLFLCLNQIYQHNDSLH